LLDKTSQYSYANGGEFRAVGSPDLLGALHNLAAYSPLTSGTVSYDVDGSSWGYGSGLNGHGYFQTFCIEYNEEFMPGTSYDVGISDRAKWGGQQPAGGDPLSIGTAWLYSQFAKGTLSGYTYGYGGGRTMTAGTLQQAIWWLEDEANGVRNNWIDLAETTLYGVGKTGGGYDTEIKGDANGLYGVVALNLGAAGAVQDQLALVPEPTTMIAGALLLLPFGMSTLRVFRKSHRA
jgi:hypothetical protein